MCHLLIDTDAQTPACGAFQRCEITNEIICISSNTANLPLWIINSYTVNQKNKNEQQIHHRVWVHGMIMTDKGNIRRHLSPSSPQLLPSASLTAARRAAEWPNLLFTNELGLSSPFPQMYTLPLNVTRQRRQFITIISGPLITRLSRKRGGKKTKDTGKCKTGGGSGEGGGGNKRCASISDLPLALSYQSHWLAHVILLWFGSANQWAAVSLPVTVQPLGERRKIP